MTAVRRIRKFEPGRGCFEQWLAGIAGNVLRNHWRRWSREGVSAVPPPEPVGPAGEDLAISEQISMAMAALPGRYRAVLVAKYEEELTVAEIADRWRETAKSVESVLSRARAAFRGVYRRLEEGASPV